MVIDKQCIKCHTLFGMMVSYITKEGYVKEIERIDTKICPKCEKKRRP